MARVLVVGLDPPTRSYFRRVISPAGHEVVCAGTASEASYLLSISSFDLAFVDMGIGAAPTLELILEAREGRNVPVVAIPGSGPDGSAVFEPTKFGAAAVLAKPYNADEIRSVISVQVRPSNPASSIEGIQGRHAVRKSSDAHPGPAGGVEQRPREPQRQAATT